MSHQMPVASPPYLDLVTTRKVTAAEVALTTVPDSLAAWVDRYLALAVTGARSAGVARKIALHLVRFGSFVTEAYGHNRLSTCLRRDVLAWQAARQEHGLAPSTINNHLASLSALPRDRPAHFRRRHDRRHPERDDADTACCAA
jgi:hypothetical protein